jgi:hypothetical protein
MLSRKSTLPLAGLALLATLAAPGALSPAQADGVRTLNCIGRWGSASCVSTWRRGFVDPHIIPVPTPLSDLAIKESQERDKLWDSHCKPSVRHDEYGVARNVYAAQGCEFGRSR